MTSHLDGADSLAVNMIRIPPQLADAVDEDFVLKVGWRHREADALRFWGRGDSSGGNAEAYVCAGALRHKPDATTVRVDDGARDREPEAC